MWRPPSSECGALQPAPSIGWSGLVAKTPLRGLGELALATLASYVLTRQHGLVWWCSAAIVGAVACGRRVATLPPGSDLPRATAAVLHLVLVGAAGLLWAVLGALAVDYPRMRRLAGGGLAVSAMVVVGLFPALVALLLAAADAAGAAQSA